MSRPEIEGEQEDAYTETGIIDNPIHASLLKAPVHTFLSSNCIRIIHKPKNGYMTKM